MLSFEKIGNQLRMVHIYTHSKQIAQDIPKENKPAVVTAANAKSLSLRTNTYNEKSGFHLTPKEFCIHQREKSRYSDIFNTKSTTTDQPPMYALATPL